jgi:8-oxo-dGTP pyrophosphatase MutT (NUDIX family)
MRGAHHRFSPNRLVFPGGAVDPVDMRAACATPLRPETRRLLEKSARPRLAHALAMAATRELMEETGLSLGEPPELDGLDYLCRAVTPSQQPIRFNARFLVVDGARMQGTLGGSGELEDLRWYGVREALALDLHPVQRGVLEHLRAWLDLPPAERSTLQTTPVFRNMRWRPE